MSKATMLYHVHGDDEVSTVVRDDGTGPYARLHVNDDLIVFAHGPELLRMCSAIGDALDELAAGRGWAVFEAPREVA